ncbi:starch synthase [Steroidobacter denitrificans]|uniref:Glycogen synthase n=1 Tax=Steroidobacter denitrificans TaxID=465721 RepID=A0A127FBR1_STEDE|nr:starch synthase [Steroidobacter denitrificans]
MRICFIASEVAPLAKSGGLADVASALPRALHEQGCDVRVFMPLYAGMSSVGLTLQPLSQARAIELHLGAQRYEVALLHTQIPGSSVPLYLVHCPAAYDRPTLYTGDADEHLRFLILQHAALQGCQRLGFAPQIVHCNDWHTALMPSMLRSLYAWDRLFADARSLLSIHNIGYQGNFPAATIADVGGDIGVQPGTLADGTFNWLREGVLHADAVTTVSPTYAREICTPMGAHGLDATLRSRADGVTGILNGVDYQEWNPAADRYLKHHYTPQDMSGKAATKRTLLDWFNLETGDAPLLGIVSRLTVQKGFDLLFEVLPDILTTRDLGILALGSGDALYETFFTGLQQRFPERVMFHCGYSDELAHLIEAASDMFLMPSMYEPCGLNQMYSLKYGTVPIVRRTGGLADSVQAWDPSTRSGTGIVFNDFDASAVRWALGTALDLYQDRDTWKRLVRNGMAQDFSWPRQSRQYLDLYRRLLGAPVRI